MKRLLSVLSTHPRLILSAALGIAAYLILPDSLRVPTRGLLAWNITVWSYICLMSWLMLSAGHDGVRKISEREDENALTILAILSIAATVSLAAIVLELATSKHLSGGMRAFQYAITGATVVGAWCLLGIIFTAHYARMFYTAPLDQRPLRFPDGEQSPNYWDFLYFSLTIAVAAQTSDVCVMSRSMRKVVIAQSVLAFVFNVAILGFSINVSAGLIGDSL
jgi:uncharacterized membrane protein